MTDRVILLVEDNPRDEALTIRALTKSTVSSKVVVTHDGVEALDYLFGTGSYEGRDVYDQPKLVLLDLKLPKVNGLQVLEKIRGDERTRRLPVVIFTSSNEEEDLNRSYNLGVNSYVRKPIDFDEFLEATQQVVLYWLSLNLPPPKGVIC
jgi:two-component system response regulator